MEQQNFVPGSGKTQCMGCMQFYNAEFDVCPFCGYQKDTPVKAPCISSQAPCLWGAM